MITDEQFNSLGDMVEDQWVDSREAQEVHAELLYAILSELRTLRKATERHAEQFDQLSSGGISVARVNL